MSTQAGNGPDGAGVVDVVVELADPWDWNPPWSTVRLVVDDSVAWPSVGVITSAWRTNSDVVRGDPPFNDDLDKLLGRSVELRLRLQYERPPTLDERPVVYAIIGGAEDEPSLLGYGRIRAVGDDSMT